MASTRKTGKLAALYLHASGTPALASVVKFADTTNWRFEAEVAMHQCSRKGEGYARFMPGIGSARFTAEARLSTLSALVVMANDNLASGSMPGFVRVAFKLVTLSTQAVGATLAAAGAGVAGMQLIQGFGWVARGSLQTPFDNPIIEDFEMQVDGDWEFVTTT